MKTHFSLIVLILQTIALNLSSQGTINILTELKQNESTDYEAWGIDIDQKGYVYWPVNIDTMNSGYDIVCFKYDEDGNEIWDQPLVISAPGVQQSYVINHHNDQLYIGGRTCSGLVNTCDMFIAKANSENPLVEWTRSYNFPSNGYDEIDGLDIYNDTIYTGGWAQSLETGIYNSDIGFWTLDQNGETIWLTEHGQLGSAEHQDGHFVVDENHIYAAGLWGGTGIANLYNGHAYLGKYDRQNGELLDSVLFGFHSNQFLDIENALGMTSDGTYLYVTGYTTPNNVNDWQIFVTKYSKDFTQEWYVLWGAEDAESARAISVHGDKLYIGGVTGSPSLSNGGQDAVFLVYNKHSGELLEEFTWGEEFDDSVRDIASNDDHVFISGTSSNIPSGSSAFLARYSTVSQTYDEHHTNNYNIDIYPNPASDQLTITSNNKILSIKLFSLNGEVLQHHKNINKSYHEIETYGITDGSYIIQCYFENALESIKFQKF